MDDKVTLLPCPFCGSSAIFIEYDHGDYLPEEPDYMVRCEGEGMHQLDHVGHKDELAKVWNRRQAQEAPKAASGDMAPNAGCDETCPLCVFNPKAESVDQIYNPESNRDHIPKAASQSAELFDDLDFYESIFKTTKNNQGMTNELMGYISKAFAAQRQAGREEVRSILTEAMEAMDERRCYLDIWEWKYKERWDKEDAAIRKSLSDLDEARKG